MRVIVKRFAFTVVAIGFAYAVAVYTHKLLLSRRLGYLQECTGSRIGSFAVAISMYSSDNDCSHLDLKPNSIENLLKSENMKKYIRGKSEMLDWQALDCFGNPLVFIRTPAEDVIVGSVGANGQDDNGASDDMEALSPIVQH